MQIELAPRAAKQYRELSPALRTLFDKQRAFLRENVRHPSLHAKKYDESRGVWQARINRKYRFYFVIEGEFYYIVSITPHPK